MVWIGRLVVIILMTAITGIGRSVVISIMTTGTIVSDHSVSTG
jgi:hypothetical protein